MAQDVKPGFCMLPPSEAEWLELARAALRQGGLAVAKAYLTAWATRCPDLFCPGAPNITLSCPASVCEASALDLYLAVVLFLAGLLVGGVVFGLLVGCACSRRNGKFRSVSEESLRAVAAEQVAKARARAGRDGFGSW